MKNSGITILALFVVLSFKASAQLNFKQTNNGGFLQFSDLNGKSLLNDKYDPAIEGIPFISNDWADADILTKDEILVKKVRVNMNIESNEMYYLDSNNKTLIAVEGIVKKVSFSNLISKENIPYIFKNGYPAIHKQNTNYYYQVFCEGKIELIKNIYKTIESFKNEMSGEKRKEFVESSRYYIFSPAGIEPLQNNKEPLLVLMKDREPEMRLYLETNKINFRKIPDLQKLINYYNGLK